MSRIRDAGLSDVRFVIGAERECPKPRDAGVLIPGSIPKLRCDSEPAGSKLKDPFCATCAPRKEGRVTKSRNLLVHASETPPADGGV